jgi:hypothetical protein
MHPRVLFVCKRRALGGDYSYTAASGLRNSVRFMVEMLADMGVPARQVDVIDNNCIDREVAAFKPDVCIIEALWVVPSKFEVLQRLHPNVHFVVRLHSEVPFLAMEGIAMEWIAGYLRQGIVTVAPNSDRLYDDLAELYGHKHLVYLPNHYVTEAPVYPKQGAGWLDIGCFGAVRPLKNHLIQAVAAIHFARSLRRPLAFHINAGRVEQRGDTVLKNVRALFDNTPDATLIEWSWMPYHRFKSVAGSMDLGMQVSFSETFNIVTADMVDSGVPMVTSPEVRWVSRLFHATPTSVPSIVGAMNRAWYLHSLMGNRLNRRGLEKHNREAFHTWAHYLGVVRS